FDPGTSNRKAALESMSLLVPITFRSSWKRVLQWSTNFGKWALGVSKKADQAFAKAGRARVFRIECQRK
ncbi:hypothetical protein, partial [Bradyrhizobium sp.]|uniref:hypothetical protein n=1 Tax=Bradyrhizobium sp. TaxID=376 RepID=UPI003C650EB5